MMKIKSPALFRENRAKFPEGELRSHEGRWVAFSADGTRIVASAVGILELSREVERANESMQDVVLERVEAASDDILVGGAEYL